MAFKPTTKTTPDADEIILFTGKNFTGNAYSSVIGDKVSVPSALNDKLYSVKVGVGASVTLIRDYGFSGPTLKTDVDIPEISLGGPGSGLSCFIVLQKIGKYVVRFGFSDKIDHTRSLKLISSNFNPSGEDPNPGVVIPNPNPIGDEDPYAPRVFSILNENNTYNNAETVATYVRKSNGEYEAIDGLLLIYLTDNKNVAIKDFSDYNYGKLTYKAQGNTLYFVWG